MQKKLSLPTKIETSINSMAVMENEVQKTLAKNEESSYCLCSICKNGYEIKSEGKGLFRHSSLMKATGQALLQFLSLLSAIDKKKYFKLQIPDIVFFREGQITTIYKSGSYGIERVKVTPSLKKNIVDFLLETRKAPISSNKQFRDFMKSSQKYPHIKYFDEIFPSYRNTQTKTNPKQQNIIFHGNAKYEDDVMVGRKSGPEQICLVKFLDHEGPEMNSDKQIRQLMKSEKLKNVDFIQKGYQSTEKQDQYSYADYTAYKNLENPFMYNRSLIHVKMEMGLIDSYSQNYIPIEHLEQYEQLLKQIPQQYCLYQTYKMIHYMETIRDVKVERLNTAWVKDQMKQISFYGLIQFSWQQNQTLKIDLSYINELDQLMTKNLTQFEEQLLNAWQHMKNRKHNTNSSSKKKIDEKQQREQEELLKKIKEENMLRNEKHHKNEKKRKNSKKF